MIYYYFINTHYISTKTFSSNRLLFRLIAHMENFPIKQMSYFFKHFLSTQISLQMFLSLAYFNYSFYMYSWITCVLLGDNAQRAGLVTFSNVLPSISPVNSQIYLLTPILFLLWNLNLQRFHKNVSVLTKQRLEPQPSWLCSLYNSPTANCNLLGG